MIGLVVGVFAQRDGFVALRDTLLADERGLLGGFVHLSLVLPSILLDSPYLSLVSEHFEG